MPAQIEGNMESEAKKDFALGDYLDGTLGKLPVLGSSSRPSISCVWGHDGCLAAAAWVRPSSQQALVACHNG